MEYRAMLEALEFVKTPADPRLKPIANSLVQGLLYEIIPRISPGHTKPAGVRRNSIDLGVDANLRSPAFPDPRPASPPKDIRGNSIKSGSKGWAPTAVINSGNPPLRDIPPQWKAQVIYQATDAPEKTWTGFFTEEDTEYSIEQLAKTFLNTIGAWRRKSYFRDETGIRIGMTNRSKEVEMQYLEEGSGEIKTVPISETDTVRVILLRLKAKGNFHLTDAEGKPFKIENVPFGYVSNPATPPLKLLHGSALRGKPREDTPRKDGRIAVEVNFEDDGSVYPRGIQATYTSILEHAVRDFGITTPTCFKNIRAEEDRIIIEIKLGDDASWFTEKACPPLKLSEDRIFTESTGTGGWGRAPAPMQSFPMQTRSASKAPPVPKKVKDVFLYDAENDDLIPVGRTADYNEAIEMARRSGRVRIDQNVAITSCEEERFVVTAKKGAIVSGDGIVTKSKPAVTAPKPKARKEIVLPEKLVGLSKNPAVSLGSRNLTPDVPGILNILVVPSTFKKCVPRPLSGDVGHWDIRVDILKEQLRKIRIRQDANMSEILAQAFSGIDISDEERLKIVAKPLKMEHAATFVVERCTPNVKLALAITIWNGSTRRCGIEISPRASQKEIVDAAQVKIDDEKLEEAHRYVILHNGTPATQPWIHKEYELRPIENAMGSSVVQGRFGTMTVPLPLFQKNRWETIIRDSLPDRPAAIIETEHLKFRVYYLDEEVLCHVRFVTDEAGEEHLVDLLPAWQSQMFKINQAFGREMIPDDLKPSKDNVVFVKSKDGQPPDPQFERLLKYTLGDESEVFSVRVKKGQTTRDLKEALKTLHPGINPAQILLEGSAMDDSDAVNEWASITGTSRIIMKVALDQPVQRFRVWQNGTMYDLGDEDLNGRSKEDIWQSLKARNPMLNSIVEYKLYDGQNEVQWSDLPVLDVTLVSNPFMVPFRGTDFKLSDRFRTPKVREVGPLTPMTYQLFTKEKDALGEPIDILAPNEISLAQLVTYFILPAGRDFDVSSVFFWNLKEISADKEDKTKIELKRIPSIIPNGFNLRVKCNTLRSASRKQMAHVKWGSAKMNFAMDPNEKMRRLKERVSDWMNQNGQGTDWTIDRPDDDDIVFSTEFEVVPLVRDVPIRIFLKQAELEVMSSVSWINLSDQLVKRWDLPKGSLLQIRPVTGDVDDRDPDDQSYSIVWEKDKQYWYHIVYDPSKDREGLSKEIIMVDEFDRTDTLVVPANANAYQVRDLWSQMLELPRDVTMEVAPANGREFYWTVGVHKTDPFIHICFYEFSR
jgi:hypothetical protein